MRHRWSLFVPLSLSVGGPAWAGETWTPVPGTSLELPPGWATYGEPHDGDTLFRNEGMFLTVDSVPDCSVHPDWAVDIARPAFVGGDWVAVYGGVTPSGSWGYQVCRGSGVGQRRFGDHATVILVESIRPTATVSDPQQAVLLRDLPAFYALNERVVAARIAAEDRDLAARVSGRINRMDLGDHPVDLPTEWYLASTSWDDGRHRFDLINLDQHLYAELLWDDTNTRCNRPTDGAFLDQAVPSGWNPTRLTTQGPFAVVAACDEYYGPPHPGALVVIVYGTEHEPIVAQTWGEVPFARQQDIRSLLWKIDVDFGGRFTTWSNPPPAPHEPKEPPKPKRELLGVDLSLSLANIEGESSFGADGFGFIAGGARLWDKPLGGPAAWVYGGRLLLGYGKYGLNYDLQGRGGVRLGGDRETHLMAFLAAGGDGYGTTPDPGVEGNRRMFLGAYGCGGANVRLGGGFAVHGEAAWCVRSAVSDQEVRWGAGLDFGSWNLGMWATRYRAGGAPQLAITALTLGKTI